MNPNEPQFCAYVSFNALRKWLDFWELSGGYRADIVRLVPSGGEPSKMVPPETTEVTVSKVPVVVVDSDDNLISDRAGDIAKDRIRFELIDRVHRNDRIRFNGLEYRVDKIDTKDIGGFTVWIVECTRV